MTLVKFTKTVSPSSHLTGFCPQQVQMNVKLLKSTSFHDLQLKNVSPAKKADEESQQTGPSFNLPHLISMQKNWILEEIGKHEILKISSISKIKD